MTETAAPTELPKQYDHTAAQDRWYAHWQAEGYFHSEPNAERQPYTIVIPPPNVTGALHLGHALNGTLQDIAVRNRRMRGFDTLWIPGTDHAGIATQAVVERKLSGEGKTREDLGREAFLEEVWKWKEEHGNQILKQFRALGASCDWTRTAFTMDERLSRAVRVAFVRLWEKGLIYRGARIVNWDCKLQTAVSDDEVEMLPQKSKLYYLRYPVKGDGEGEAERHVTVATTRWGTHGNEHKIRLAKMGERLCTELESSGGDIGGNERFEAGFVDWHLAGT